MNSAHTIYACHLHKINIEDEFPEDGMYNVSDIGQHTLSVTVWTLICQCQHILHTTV